MTYSANCAFEPAVANPLGSTTPRPTSKPTTPQPSIADLDCDFEGKTKCKWFNDPQNKYTDWKVARASDGIDISGYAPSGDHTTGTLGGYYLAFDDQTFYRSALVGWHSPDMNGTKCLEFWYYMYGTETGTLNVYQKWSTKNQKLWGTTTSDQLKWRLAQATIKPQPNVNKYFVRIQFQFTAPTFSGFVAIDDILVHEGECIQPSDSQICTFEFYDFCGYMNDPKADFDWVLGDGTSQQSSLTGPLSDHTLGGEQEGVFAYIDAKKQKKSDKARLISPIHTKTASTCVQFFYNANGADIGSLILYSRINEVESKQWVHSGPLNLNQWYMTEQTIKSPQSDWQVVIEGVVGDGPNGNIAIDDIKITRGECRHFGDCDFEDKNLCDYTNSPAAEIGWVVKEARLSVWPTVDNTLKTGYGSIAQLVISANAKLDWRGQLVSQPLEPVSISKSRCVEFFYNMYRTPPSSYASTLNVKLLNLKTLESTLLWSLKYSQGKDWKRGRINYESSELHQIIFEGVKGDGVGDVSLDDIKFLRACSFAPSEARPNVTITTTPSPTFFTTQTESTTTYSFVPQSDVDCDFDVDFCTWTVDTTQKRKWSRYNNSLQITLNNNDPPSGDHTTGKGSYIFLDMTGPSPDRNEKAQIISKVIKPADQCFGNVESSLFLTCRFSY